MTSAERERRARELHDALNTAYPADNHDSLDDHMRVMMLALSRESNGSPVAPKTAAPGKIKRSLVRRIIERLTGRRSR